MLIIDLTHCIRDGLPVYPGDDQTVLTHSRTFSADGYNNHQLSINMHAGTHIDGPMHLLDIQQRIHEVPIDQFIGDGVLLDVRHASVVDYEPSYEQMIPERSIVIVCTGHGDKFGSPEYFSGHPELTPAFAELLIRKQVKLVGLDFPSPDRYPFQVHKMLFTNNVLIAENLANTERLIGIGPFEVIALPLRIEADSSIARIIARTTASVPVQPSGS
ncbi:cyclase family protein [Paenibacillus kobensis]|uniref:cyclase family protein n=1 Tax=Paenibacillus kobensis TaxID=59841 RepID=UPI001FE27672|nr:cyclase family protein [Paenibacillus kobensis]